MEALCSLPILSCKKLQKKKKKNLKGGMDNALRPILTRTKADMERKGKERVCVCVCFDI